jgi:hypothetical protein
MGTAADLLPMQNFVPMPLCTAVPFFERAGNCLFNSVAVSLALAWQAVATCSSNAPAGQGI